MLKSPSAIRTLVKYATESINSRPPETQAEIYDAVAALLPDKEQRMHAARLAFAIRETAKLQREFAFSIHPRRQRKGGKQS